ncbi:MAG: P-II family nitrogen regulator [Gammaproteobacteria bacterium]
MSNIVYLTDVWMITCIVSAGSKKVEKMLLAARDAGARGAVGHHARGYGARERLGALAVAVEAEKDVINILVSTEQREIVFESMFNAGGLDEPGAGLMYITPVEKAATYVPDSIASRLRGGSGGGGGS